jgi:hypothetical protein
MTEQQQQDSSEQRKPLESEESASQQTTSTEFTDMVTPYVSHTTTLMEQLLALKLRLNQKTSITREDLQQRYLVNTYFLQAASELSSLKEN